MSIVDLDKPEKDVKINSFLIDISNVYVSENSIYLLNESYYNSYTKNYISKIFGIKGIFGLSDYENDYYDDDSYRTEIYKFDILKNSDISYKAKNKVEGTTIDQYSLDEKDRHLRIASYNEEGAKIAIFDSKLKQIGKSENVGKNGEMYSTRFIGNKAYLVTYKTIDPLFVIDLSNEKNPKEISKTVIGDSRTTSAVLTNSKALLFSKEKNLLAIPVNNYE